MQYRTTPRNGDRISALGLGCMRFPGPPGRPDPARARELIAPYVTKDPTAFVSYDEFLAGIEAIEQFCMLRADSIRGQLAGTIPTTLDGQTERPESLVDASELDLTDLGELSDLDQ